MNSAETKSDLTGQNALIISYKGSDFNNFGGKFEKVKILKNFKYELTNNFKKDYSISFGENFNPSKTSQK